jgi:hypothetical protein
MCDYSLHSIRSRPAKIGDRLMTTGFPGSTTRGFAAVDDPAVAICLRAGTELAFDRDVEHGSIFARWLPFLRRNPIGRVARFRLVNTVRPDTHHDSLEFADGTVVLVTGLRRGQRATILQLPKDMPTASPAFFRVKESAGEFVDITPDR